MKRTLFRNIVTPLPIRVALLLFFASLFFNAISQSKPKDPAPAATDSIKVGQLNASSKQYWMKNFDSSMYYAQQALQLSQTSNYTRGIAESYRNMGVTNMYLRDKNLAEQYLQKALGLFASLPDMYSMAATYNNLGVLHTRMGDYIVSQGYLDSALILFRKLGNKEGEGSVLNYIGISYQQQGNYQKAIDYCLQGFEIRKQINDHIGVVFSLLNVGNMYLDVGQPQTALNFYTQAVSHAKDHQLDPPDYLLNQVGKTYLKLKEYDKAETYLVRTINGKERQITDHLSAGDLYAETGRLDSAIQLFKIGYGSAPDGNYNNRALSLVGLSKIFFKKEKYEQALTYAEQAYIIADSAQNKLTLAESANILATLYKTRGEYKKSIQFFEMAHSITDSVSDENYQRKLAFTESKNEIENKQASIKLLSAEKDLQRQKLKSEQSLTRFILIVSALALVLSLIIIRNINAKRKKIQSQKDHIEEQREKIEQSYEDLKSTQAQLIQKEKMASLGELTVGIAHEIQNPLNFINNFSEVNEELLSEMKEQIEIGNLEEAKLTARNIADNQGRINHHGKRADAIVKGMLQHGQSSSSQNEPTDINALADEYLRLAYHGLKAKDKTFNSAMKTDFDDRIGKINIIPQEIGRVILNLLNNAFYAVGEKQKQNIPGYEPIVTVTSRKVNGRVELSVTDNGNGIPQKLLDKIFQPFFTTKPTGQGTGLGLSLAYDIVKAHGGDLKVTTKEGEGSEFIISV